MVADVAVDGLGVAPGARTGGGVAGVADGQVPVERGQRAVVEGVGHQAHVLHHGDGVPVAHGHAGGFLAPVLQGVEAEVGQVGDGLARGVDPEHPAGLLGGVVVDPVLGHARRRTTARSLGAHDVSVAVGRARPAATWARRHACTVPAPSASGRRRSQPLRRIGERHVEQALHRDPFASGHPDAGGRHASLFAGVEHGGDVVGLNADHHTRRALAEQLGGVGDAGHVDAEA